MSTPSYESILAHARQSDTPELPAFEQLAPTIAIRREARLGEDAQASLRARRWLVLAARAFALMPLDTFMKSWLVGTIPRLSGVAFAVLLPVFMLAWAARLVTRPSFRAQLLVRSITVSNLVVALLLALSVGGMISVGAQALVALSCYRALRLLGMRGLDGSVNDETFTPVAFRGFLILALIMAFADAQTLMFSALTQASYAFTGARGAELLPFAGPTLLAALIMGLNVWGLLRLKTWAMLLNIVANLVIARLALTQVLSVNMFVAASLAVTAGIQLMLPVPILAAWIGDREAGGAGWQRGARLLQACLPVMLVATPVSRSKPANAD